MIKRNSLSVDDNIYVYTYIYIYVCVCVCVCVCMCVCVYWLIYWLISRCKASPYIWPFFKQMFLCQFSHYKLTFLRHVFNLSLFPSFMCWSRPFRNWKVLFLFLSSLRDFRMFVTNPCRYMLQKEGENVLNYSEGKRERDRETERDRVVEGVLI